MGSLLVGLCLAGAAIGPVAAQSPAARVDAIAAPYAGARPGFGVLVVRRDSVLLMRGYGLANVQRSEPITPHTRFLLGSVSKQFTAMAVMILADRSEVAYDDAIAKYLPELSGRVGRITVRQLLHHQGGLPEYERLFVDRGLVDRDWPRSVTTPPSRFEPTARDALALLADTDSLEFAPGTRFEYSNSGYLVLAQIVERVSGQRFAEFLRDNVFEPLGMGETVLYDERRPAIPDRASSYTGEGGAFREIDYTPFNAIYGEDNVVTSLHDLVQWVRTLDHPTLVRPATQTLAFTPGTLGDGGSTSYGFGWFEGAALGQRLILHGGSWVGFRTAIVRFPADSLTVVVLANAAETDSEILAVRIGQAWLGDRAPLPAARAVSPAVLRRAEGRYQIRPGLVATLAAADGRLVLDAPHLGTEPLGFDSDSTAFFAGDGVVRVLFHGGAGPWRELEIVRPSGRFTARRVEP
jgi:CubicO group peptidase (beta-lactamase class C family)